MKNKYQQKLSGATLQAVGRSANMAWFIFHSNEGLTLSLHMQCVFMLSNAQKFLLTSSDFFRPALSLEQKNFLDWDVQGANRYDEIVSSLTFDDSWCVAHCYISGNSNLKLIFKNGYQLETFCDRTRESEAHRVSDEKWRLFELGNVDEAHLVAYINHMEME